MLAWSDVDSHTDEIDRPTLPERGWAAAHHPTLHAVRSVDAIFDAIYAIAVRVGAPGNLGLNPSQIVRMHTLAPDVVVDMRIWRQTPYRLNARIPFKGVRLRIPPVKSQTEQIDGSLQPRFILSQTCLGTL